MDQFQSYVCHCNTGYEGKYCNYGEDGSPYLVSVLKNTEVSFLLLLLLKAAALLLQNTCIPRARLLVAAQLS